MPAKPWPEGDTIVLGNRSPDTFEAKFNSASVGN